MAIVQFFLVFFICAGANGELVDIDGNEEYRTGLTSYQKGNFETARINFAKALESHPTKPEVLFNLGLAEYQMENWGWALAYWRKALYLQPSFDPARKAIDFHYSSNSSLVSLDSAGSSYEWLRVHIFGDRSLDTFLMISAITLAIAAWLMLRFLGQRRRAFNEDIPLPPFPSVGLFASLVFVACAAMAGLKGFDITQPRATVVREKVELRAGPHREENILIELLAGIEVIIERSSENWVQVTQPGGFTGWVPKDSIFHNYGKQPW